MKRILIALAALAVIVGGIFFWRAENAAAPAAVVPAAQKNLPAYVDGVSFSIENVPTVLASGHSEIPLAESSAKIATDYFGNGATGDLNGDGIPDAAFLVTQSQGGSGTFFYAVAAIKAADGWKGTNGVIIGDRIAPQSTEIRDGQIFANYADRKPGEAMVAVPSVGATMILRVRNGILEQIVKK